MKSPIGILGGSGLYDIEGLIRLEEINVDTPFGKPSDLYLRGTLEGTDVIFLTRHGRGHRLLPSEINYRANIWGMKKLGVETIVSVSAVGSLKEEIVPGHLVFVDQFIDRTYRRNPTFFGDGAVAHVAFADPICPKIRALLAASATDLQFIHHAQGTYICIEGPQFSTRAESNLYRSFGADVIGMTNVTEAKLAREAGLCYATVALATDYDCWHSAHDAVTADQVLKTLQENVAKAKKLLAVVLSKITKADFSACACQRAMDHALFTDPSKISDSIKQRLDLLVSF